HRAAPLLACPVHQLAAQTNRPQPLLEGDRARGDVRGKLAQRMPRCDVHVIDGKLTRVDEHTVRRDRLREDGRLRVVRRRQHGLGAVPAELRGRGPQGVSGFLEGPAGDVARLGQVAPHTAELRALAGKQQPYHRITPEAHVNPAPNATIRTLSPGLTRPCSTASSSAIGTVAELMLPYRSRV